MQRSALGTAMPPAAFPPILGFFGLALAWRRAATAYGVPSGLGEMLLGLAAGLWLFATALYLRKMMLRPAAVVEDASALPGRGGIATAILGAMVLAAALVPLWPGVALAVALAAVAVLVAYDLVVIRVLLTGPTDQRRVTPIWHLTFVGFVVAPMSLAPLGYTGLAWALLIWAAAMAVVIYAVSLRQFLAASVPAPLRPLLAIHLAPLSFAGIDLVLLGEPFAARIVAAVATLLFLLFLARARWLTAAGFLPFWGAFTFPLAAYASLMALMAGSGVLRLWGVAVLLGATVVISWILWRVLKLWPGGRLAKMTNAARA